MEFNIRKASELKTQRRDLSKRDLNQLILRTSALITYGLIMLYLGDLYISMIGNSTSLFRGFMDHLNVWSSVVGALIFKYY